MLTIYTSTCCRPDLVQLLADAVAATFRGDYRLVVYVHAGGISRPWRNVHEVRQGKTAGYMAWREITGDLGPGRSLIIHDDCVPTRPWSEGDLPAGHNGRAAGSTVMIHDGPWQAPFPSIRAIRVGPSNCPAQWAPFQCEAVAWGAESMMGGLFCHIDKGTIGKRLPKQRALVVALAKHLGIKAPAELDETEALSHKGRDWPREPPSPPGLGDMVAGALSSIGITKERVSAAIGKPCRCEQRQQAMNELGRRLGIG